MVFAGVNCAIQKTRNDLSFFSNILVSPIKKKKRKTVAYKLQVLVRFLQYWNAVMKLELNCTRKAWSLYWNAMVIGEAGLEQQKESVESGQVTGQPEDGFVFGECVNGWATIVFCL